MLFVSRKYRIKSARYKKFDPQPVHAFFNSLRELEKLGINQLDDGEGIAETMLSIIIPAGRSSRKQRPTPKRHNLTTVTGMQNL